MFNTSHPFFVGVWSLEFSRWWLGGVEAKQSKEKTSSPAMVQSNKCDTVVRRGSVHQLCVKRKPSCVSSPRFQFASASLLYRAALQIPPRAIPPSLP